MFIVRLRRFGLDAVLRAIQFHLPLWLAEIVANTKIDRNTRKHVFTRPGSKVTLHAQTSNKGAYR